MNIKLRIKIRDNAAKPATKKKKNYILGVSFVVNPMH